MKIALGIVTFLSLMNIHFSVRADEAKIDMWPSDGEIWLDSIVPSEGVKTPATMTNLECFFKDGLKFGTLTLASGSSSLTKSPTDIKRCTEMPSSNSKSQISILMCAGESRPHGKDSVVDTSYSQLIILNKNKKAFRVGYYSPNLNYFISVLDGTCK